MLVQTFLRRYSLPVLWEMEPHRSSHEKSRGVVPGRNTSQTKLSCVKCYEQTGVSFESCHGSARFEFIKSTHFFLLLFASGWSSLKNGTLWRALSRSLSGLLLHVGKMHRKGISMTVFPLRVYNLYTWSMWVKGKSLFVYSFFNFLLFDLLIGHSHILLLWVLSRIFRFSSK